MSSSQLVGSVVSLWRYPVKWLMGDAVTDEPIPEGTFFDAAVVHVLSTTTIDVLRAAYPEGRFEVRRFRPNVVLQTASKREDFIENGWADGALAIGSQVCLNVTGPCPRCVMP